MESKDQGTVAEEVPIDVEDGAKPAEEAAEEAAQRQALLMEKLKAKGKVMVQGSMMAVVDGEVCEVRAYDPKEGAYIVQLPSHQLASVKPTQIVRLKDIPPEEEDRTVVSKYSSLKTW